MAKTRKKKTRKNPGRMAITNPGKNKGGNRKPRGFIGRALNRLAGDGKDAALVLGGRYAAEVAAELGGRHLAKTAGKYAVPAGQLVGWFALWRLLKKPWARMLRLGLLSEAIHGMAVMQGIDIPQKVLSMIPSAGVKAPAPEGAATESSSGLGMMQRRFSYAAPDPYFGM